MSMYKSEAIRKHDYEVELAINLAEEAAEVIKEAMKISRFKTCDFSRLEEEVADVLAIVDLLHEYDIVSWTRMEEFKKRKIEKMKLYSNLVDD